MAHSGDEAARGYCRYIWCCTNVPVVIVLANNQLREGFRIMGTALAERIANQICRCKRYPIG